MLKRWWTIAMSPAAAGFLFTSTVFLVSVFFHAPDHPTFFICPFKNMTGIDCPGCGLTRSFCALGKGEVHRALHFHLLGPLLFALFGLWWLCSLLQLLGQDQLAIRMSRPLLNKPAGFGLVILFAVAWVLHLNSFGF